VSTAVTLNISALEKFKEFTDEKKHGAEQAEINKRNGYCFKTENRVGGHIKEHLVVVTGNDGSGSQVYLLDRGTKLGDGSKGDVYIAYDLQQAIKIATDIQQKVDVPDARLHEIKVAAKIFNKESSSDAVIANEKTNLMLLKRFKGCFLGEFAVVFMRLEEGSLLVDYLYYLNQSLKKSDPSNYKGSPDYYTAKIIYPYRKRLDMLVAVIRALAEIHQSKLIHRDVSLDNCMIHELQDGYQSVVIDVETAIDENRKLSRLELTYGFAAPEFFKERKDGEVRACATYASDYYALGVVMLDILTSCNLQKSLQDEFKNMMVRENYFRQELPTKTLKAMAPDVFGKLEELVFDSSSQTLEDYIYLCFVLPALRVHLNDLLADDPAMRLRSSSLEMLAQQVLDLRNRFVTLLDAISSIIKGLSGLNKLKNETVTLKLLQPVILELCPDGAEAFDILQQLLTESSSGSRPGMKL
jgi:serine/threonine protein kinase